MTYFDDFEIDSMDDLLDLIDSVGFVPFFENEIEGFSIEEHIAPGHWYYDSGDGFWDAWEWKGPVIKTARCAYGKFLRGKAMYISSKWFPDFANYRRDGYDFDARFEDGLASIDDGDLAGFKVSTEYIGRKCDMDVTYVNSNYFIVIRLYYK